MDETVAPSGASRECVAAARHLVDSSRTMVARSIARLIATNPHPTRPAMADAILDIVESPCDLDVLMFVQKRPRALLGVDDIARIVGHDVEDVHASMQAFRAAGLVACSETPGRDHGAPVLFYEFTPGQWDAILSSLLWVAASPHGRDALRRALAHLR